MATSEEDYKTLHFTSDENFKKAYLTLHRYAPHRHLPDGNVNFQGFQFYERKQTDDCVGRFLFFLSMGVYDSRFSKLGSPQEIIEFLKEKPITSEYTEEMIAPMEYIMLAISESQTKDYEENRITCMSKLHGFRSFAYSEEFKPFTTETTAFMDGGKPTFTIDLKGLLEKIAYTGFTFDSQEGQDILATWKEVGRNPLVKERYNIIQKQEADKQQ